MSQTLDVQTLILSSMCNSEDAAHMLMPHIKPEYFEDESYRVIHKIVSTHINKYAKCPNKTTLLIELQNTTYGDDTCKNAQSIIDDMFSADMQHIYKNDREWAINTIEKYCKDRAIYLSIKKAIMIIDGDKVDGKLYDKGAIPKFLQDALTVSFDASIGHDYIIDMQDRFNALHAKETHLSTGLDDFDHILKGGFAPKTLNVLVAGTSTGKSTAMCSMAANNYMKGENVLYITCEMSSFKIGERIDANLFDVTLDNLPNLPIESYVKKIDVLKNTSTGCLIIEEFGPGQATINHFRALLQELKLKKGFVPTVIYIDYLNLVASCFLKNKDNMYAYYKSVAEEVRSLAIEMNVPIVTATQTNRGGQASTDPELADVSESHGIGMTCDLMVAMITTEHLEALQQIKFKQLKNRYAPVDKPRSFLVGLDRARMRLYNLSAAVQAHSIVADNAREESMKADTCPINKFGSREKSKTADWVL